MGLYQAFYIKIDQIVSFAIIELRFEPVLKEPMLTKMERFFCKGMQGKLKIIECKYDKFSNHQTLNMYLNYHLGCLVFCNSQLLSWMSSLL